MIGHVRDALRRLGGVAGIGTLRAETGLTATAVSAALEYLVRTDRVIEVEPLIAADRTGAKRQVCSHCALAPACTPEDSSCTTGAYDRSAVHRERFYALCQPQHTGAAGGVCR